MATSKECFSGSLSIELEDLHRAHSFAVEEHEKIMRIHRLQTGNRMTELAHKIAAQEKLNLANEAEKARHLEEKLEAQRLLTLVKGQLELQAAQETQQIELIKKHLEERVKFEVLRQEQSCLNSQANLRRRYESKLVVELLEAEKEASKKIAELEEKLKDLAEDIYEKNDMLNMLTMSSRQEADEVEAVMAAVLSSDFLDTFRTADIGVKNVGESYYEGWYEVCGHKFESEEKFLEWTSKLDQTIRLKTFLPPVKSVPDGNGGKMKYEIDEDDKWLTSLRNKYGPIVADSVGAAALEIETWDPCERGKIEMPWDYRLKKRATLGSIFDHLFKVLKEKVKEVEELKARTDATSSRKRGRGT